MPSCGPVLDVAQDRRAEPEVERHRPSVEAKPVTVFGDLRPPVVKVDEADCAFVHPARAVVARASTSVEVELERDLVVDLGGLPVAQSLQVDVDRGRHRGEGQVGWAFRMECHAASLVQFDLAGNPGER